MVLDARTLASFSDLAEVVRGYTTPSRGSKPLDSKQKNDACLLRFQHGWHARHIAEAMGLAPAQDTYSWEIDILEALEECTTRSDWNSQGIFLRPIQTSAGPDQSTAEGTNMFGEFRKTARTNAIIQAALLPEIRSGGRLIQPAGKERTAKELAVSADTILSRESRQGHYGGVTFSKLYPTQVAAAIAELGILFDWPGKGKALGIRELEDEEKEKVDAEILRRCRLQNLIDIEAGREPRAPYGFFTRVEREIHATFPCCGPDGDVSMEDWGYSPFSPGYANGLCLEAGLFKPVPTVKAQIADPVNQQKVKDAIGADTVARPAEIRGKTGLTQEVVEGILAVLGYGTQTTRNEAIRKIILPLHDVGRLTPSQIWAKTPELQTLIGGTRETGVKRIFDLLEHSEPPRIPWSRASLEAERRLPLRAAQLKRVFIAHLRFWNEQELARIRGNISRSQRPGQLVEESGYTITSLAAAPGWNETVEFTQRVLELLLAENMPLIALRGNDIVFPFTALRWITRGGEMLEGETG